jgi:hypothetical protein
MLGAIEDKFIAIFSDNEIIVSRVDGACNTLVSDLFSAHSNVSATLTSDEVIILDDQSLESIFLLFRADNIGRLGPEQVIAQ